MNEGHAAFPQAARVRWLLERGRLYIFEKTPSQARGLFSEALTLAIHSGEDYFAVEVAQLMAITEPQKAQPGWIMRADFDPALASATRRGFLERYCDSGVMVCATHFPQPSIGRITQREQAFWFDSDATKG